MGDTKFTLIELHIDGETRFGLGSIGEALPIGGTESVETERETDSDVSAVADEETGGSGKSAVGALVALVVLVGIAIAARKFRGDDEQPDLEAEDEPDVIIN
ncbi:hypothetical protein [Natrinema halophilum]|uniref:Uncharacterized protein n=1 Tax=Natrinema halophilum TaxID=1699371 RepID=A0A7D5GKV3_9EURY|nr:hypothetical protein [Natrinema halophilum]QLG48992.1 hypothetical protein HYG82_09085 [Natrinema halophilum]